jgi:hypothetical protein
VLAVTVIVPMLFLPAPKSFGTKPFMVTTAEEPGAIELGLFSNKILYFASAFELIWKFDKTTLLSFVIVIVVLTSDSGLVAEPPNAGLET